MCQNRCLVYCNSETFKEHFFLPVIPVERSRLVVCIVVGLYAVVVSVVHVWVGRGGGGGGGKTIGDLERGKMIFGTQSFPR